MSALHKKVPDSIVSGSVVGEVGRLPGSVELGTKIVSPEQAYYTMLSAEYNILYIKRQRENNGQVPESSG
jgi:hypothetical protein